MRSDRLRLLDILEPIHYLKGYRSTGRDTFFTDEILKSATLHRLTLIGEASRGLSAEFRQTHAGTPWAEIIAFRNVAIHQYFGLDLELVWTILADELEVLESTIQ